MMHWLRPGSSDLPAPRSSTASTPIDKEELAGGREGVEVNGVSEKIQDDGEHERMGK